MAETRGIVLSGGGARGAYEVGVVAGIVDVLDAVSPRRAPFEVFTGTSVGAINAAYLAASAHRPDVAIDGLIRQWTSLSVEKHLRLDPWGMLAGPRLGPWIARLRGHDAARIGRSFLDPSALEELVSATIDYDRLHANVDSGTVNALIIAALRVETGETTMFAELGPRASFQATRNPKHVARPARIMADHVLASSAIPLVFPARKLDGDYYCDGGIRFNTPIAPALRCGAQRLVVISPKFGAADDEPTPIPVERCYPSPLFLVGKVLDALLLDPVDYDLQVMERFNRVVDTLERALTPPEMEEFQRVLTETRGVPYRRVESLVFRPSEDIGKMAARRADEVRTESAATLLFSGTAGMGPRFQADLFSFILFDGEFARRLIDLGRRDARARRDEILRFFEPD